MATLVSNGSNQYAEFSTLGAALAAVSAGAHTIVALINRATASGFQEAVALVDSGRANAYDSLGATGSGFLSDLTRATVTGAASLGTTGTWFMYGLTLDTADTPDVVYHFRNHATNAAWTHSNATGGASPGYAAAGTPGASGFVQLFRWETTDYWNGGLGLVGIWASRLTNTHFDELKANDRTSDWWNCSAGQPAFLVECNVAESALTNIGSVSASRVAAANAPTLTGTDPDRWTFDGRGGAAASSLVIPRPPLRALIGR